MKNNIVITVLIVIIIGVIGFFAGVKYQESKQPAFSRQFGNGQQGTPQGTQRGGTRTGINRAGSRQVIGEIMSQDEKSITVKLTDESSKIVLLSETTTVNTATKAAITDLKVGEKVAVFGPQNTDGSVTAQTIQLNPIGRPTP